MYKVGRNEPCPCGSGRKYKHCCLNDREANERIIRAAAMVGSSEELAALVQAPPHICRVRVTLDAMMGQNLQETVSRTIEIEGSRTLFDLHMAIQDAFNWDNDHLYSFYMSGELGDIATEYAGNPMGGDLEEGLFTSPKSAAGAELCDFELKPGARFKYVFDYGDKLVHSIEVLDVYQAEDDSADYPRLINREGEPPPQYDVSED